MISKLRLSCELLLPFKLWIYLASSDLILVSWLILFCLNPSLPGYLVTRYLLVHHDNGVCVGWFSNIVCCCNGTGVIKLRSRGTLICTQDNSIQLIMRFLAVNGQGSTIMCVDVIIALTFYICKQFCELDLTNTTPSESWTTLLCIFMTHNPSEVQGGANTYV